MRRAASWLVGSALAAPLLGLTAWVAWGALRPAIGVPGTSTAGTAAAATLPRPDADLARDRLEDRVDGGADALRAMGCRRLLYWRITTPPADAEALVFETPEGARTALEREAGRDRTSGPGDEAQVSPQAVYFRRGSVLVRIFADPGTEAAADLARRASEIDRALVGTRL